MYLGYYGIIITLKFRRYDKITVKYIELSLLLLLALASDIKTYKIKNTIIIVFIAVGLMTNFVFNGLDGMLVSLLAAALPVILLIILFALRMLGAGDIKLFCAVGAISGVEFVLYDMAYSFIAGGVIAIIFMLLKNNFRQRSIYLLNYIKTCILTFSLQPYTDFDNKNDGAKFRFTYAIVCGTIIQMLSEGEILKFAFIGP